MTYSYLGHFFLQKIQLRCTTQLLSPIIPFDQNLSTKIRGNIFQFFIFTKFLMNQMDIKCRIHIYRLLFFQNFNRRQTYISCGRPYLLRRRNPHMIGNWDYIRLFIHVNELVILTNSNSITMDQFNLWCSLTTS